MGISPVSMGVSFSTKLSSVLDAKKLALLNLGESDSYVIVYIGFG